VEYQAEFAAFAAAYGFTPKACAVRRPQTKGKVERPFSYIYSNFFLGRSFRDLADMNAQGRTWLDTLANRRKHGTTRETPWDRFLREKPQLRPLPEQLVPVALTVSRSSTRDCLISYDGNYTTASRTGTRRAAACGWR